MVKSNAHTLRPTVMKSAAITVSIGIISFAANSTNTIGYMKNKWFDELDTNPIIIHSGLLLLKNFFAIINAIK